MEPHSIARELGLTTFIHCPEKCFCYPSKANAINIRHVALHFNPKVITMFLKFCFLSTLLFLVGCAGTQFFLRSLENSGSLRTEISEDPSYDYKVTVKNVVDFNFNGDAQEDRQKLLESMFHNQCSSVSIIDESKVQTGTYIDGRPTNFWTMKVKCSKR